MRHGVRDIVFLHMTIWTAICTVKKKGGGGMGASARLVMLSEQIQGKTP